MGGHVTAVARRRQRRWSGRVGRLAAGGARSGAAQEVEATRDFVSCDARLVAKPGQTALTTAR
jgi:hypothetical protein